MEKKINKASKRSRNEKGEGVISLAIGVLVMAALGAVMWGLFSTTMQDTSDKINDQVDQIGAP